MVLFIMLIIHRSQYYRTMKNRTMQQKQIKNIRLSPIKISKKQKLKVRQNNFVLDCTNIHAKMQSYNSLSDKFLAYYVIRLPRKKKQAKIKNTHTAKEVNSNQFKKFLQTKKQQILKDKTNQQQPIKIQQKSEEQKQKCYTQIDKLAIIESQAYTRRQHCIDQTDRQIHKKQKVEDQFEEEKVKKEIQKVKKPTKKLTRKSMQNLSKENKQNYRGQVQAEKKKTYRIEQNKQIARIQ